MPAGSRSVAADVITHIRKRWIKRKPARLAYYARNVARDIGPQFLYRRRLRPLLLEALEQDRGAIATRLHYYNKLDAPVPIAADFRRVRSISLDKSYYYYDLKEHARYFPRDLRLHYLFGDVTHIPDVPCFVKSRPIDGDNRNALLMKLDKFRHFHIPADDTPFEEKRPMAVWRGTPHNPKRVALVQRYRGHRLCDVGYTGVADNDPLRAGFLSPTEQMGFRYILSIEGNDVATNLKWVLASNSLCLMPDPVYETWFMEGRLQAGRHYVRVADDFADLEDRILHYERHPEEARAIIRNAQAFVAQFRDVWREQVLSLLVMYKAGFIHVGTGVAERAQIRVQWPDGEWSAAYRVFANNFVVIRRGEAAARYWYPQ